MQNIISSRIHPTILALLRPLPVSASDEPLYLALLGGYGSLCKPLDLVEWGFVKDLTDERWEREWCVRLKNAIREPINRSCQELSVRNQRAQQIGTTDITDKLDSGELDPDMMTRWIRHNEMLDAVHRRSDEKFQATLARIAQYKEGLGARLRRTTDDILALRGLTGVPPSASEYAASLAYRGINPPAGSEVTGAKQLGAPAASVDEPEPKMGELPDLPKAALVKPSEETPTRSEEHPPPSVTFPKAAEPAASTSQEAKTAPQPNAKPNG